MAASQVYDRLIGQLIDEVYHTMVDRTLAVDSVLEEETHTVYRAFGVLQEVSCKCSCLCKQASIHIAVRL